MNEVGRYVVVGLNCWRIHFGICDACLFLLLDCNPQLDSHLAPNNKNNLDDPSIYQLAASFLVLLCEKMQEKVAFLPSFSLSDKGNKGSIINLRLR
jgi:hypothetical protein